MKIIIVNNAKDMGARAASLVVQAIKGKPNLVLGLATGKTMIPFYKELIKLYRKKKISFAKVKSFNLDEYVGLKSRDKGSLRAFMDKNFFSKVNFKEKNINFLNGCAKNIVRECARYEARIKDLRGIDLQILGIGQDGHIGFNEPYSSFKSKTREVKLNETTREDNAELFNSLKKVPKKAFTMGVSTIMSTKKIILLASGKKKAEIIAKTVNHPMNEKVPASILQKHKDVIFVLDKGAGSELEKR